MTGALGPLQEILPYVPTAALILLAYLGVKINQTRILLSVLLLLPAYAALGHATVVLPDAIRLTAVAVPLGLALIWCFNESALATPWGITRLFLAYAPALVLLGIMDADPAGFARIMGWQPVPGGAPFRGPQAAVAASLPLAVVVAARWRDPLRRFLVVLPLICAPFLIAVHGALAGAAASGGKPEVTVAFTVLTGLLVHAVLQVYWRRVYVDELTGVFNRRALQEELLKLGGTYAVAMIDVDHFKSFNDFYGHEQGDHVLRLVAARLLQDLGPRVYRYGGEEFCAIFDGQEAGQAAAQAERARGELERGAFHLRLRRPRRTRNRGKVSPGTGRVPVTVSIGLASPVGGRSSPEQVIALADEALYRAKAKGRNCVVVAGSR